MEDLAPELLDSIFTLACTDGGFTGCSLSSVSTHIRATSRAARFHTISLPGSALQTERFLTCFVKERAEVAIRTPTVRHLHLVAIKDERPLRTPNEVTTELRQVAEDMANYVANVATLFRLVSPDLESLSLVQNHGWMRLAKLSNIQCPAGGFPALRELTIVGPDPFVSGASAALSPFYPRLTRLHIGFPTYFTWDMNFDDWAQRAPGITHLCFSEVNGASPAIEDLACAPGDKFKHLRNLLMRPIGPPVGAQCGFPYAEHEDMVEALRLLCRGAAVHAEVLPHKKRATEWSTMAKQEWLERISGGPGCWMVSEEAAGPVHDFSSAIVEPRVPRQEWRVLLESVREHREAQFDAWLRQLTSRTRSVPPLDDTSTQRPESFLDFSPETEEPEDIYTHSSISRGPRPNFQLLEKVQSTPS